MALYPIDLLNIRDKELRNQHYKNLYIKIIIY